MPFSWRSNVEQHSFEELSAKSNTTLGSKKCANLIATLGLLSNRIQNAQILCLGSLDALGGLGPRLSVSDPQRGGENPSGYKTHAVQGFLEQGGVKVAAYPIKKRETLARCRDSFCKFRAILSF